MRSCPATWLHVATRELFRPYLKVRLLLKMLSDLFKNCPHDNVIDDYFGFLEASKIDIMDPELLFNSQIEYRNFLDRNESRLVGRSNTGNDAPISSTIIAGLTSSLGY